MSSQQSNPTGSAMASGVREGSDGQNDSAGGPQKKQRTNNSINEQEMDQPPCSEENTLRSLNGEMFQHALRTKDMDTLSKHIFQEPNKINKSFQPEDCFLSHRGPDTKLDLVVPLSRMMNTLYGTTSFVDCEPTNMLAKAQADSVANAIAQSIWACKVIVIFISTNFHESEWCLKELYTALYRREKKDPSLEAVHIVYCRGMSPKVCKEMPEYAGLDLGNIWGTEFKEGTHIHEFASSQLHKVLYQLIHGGMNNIESNAVALSEWRKVCRHRYGIPTKLKYFMGREVELSEITKILQHFSSAAITTSGVGGVGKSQLVVSWVDQNLSRYFLVVWIRAEQDLTLKQDLATFGEQELGLHFSEKDNLEMRARKAMQAIKNRSTSSSPALIIFDNADSYSNLLEKDWIPQPGSYCHSIVTTRDSSSCTEEEQVQVGPLDESSSLAIIEYFLQRQLDTTNEKPKALNMLKSFGFLPLAIVNFAVFVKKFGLDDAITKIQHVMEKPVYDKRNYQGQNRKSVDAVLQAQLEALDEGARTMLEYLSVLAAENVPTSLLKSLFEKDGNIKSYHSAVEQLMDRAIVLSAGSGDKVNTHRLFQSTTVRTSSALGKTQTLLDSVADCLTSKMSDGHDQGGNHDRQYMSFYLPHAQALVHHHWPRKTEALGDLLHWYGRTMENEAQYNQAMELYEQALAIQGSALGKDHPSYANTLHAMALVHDEQGRYTQAMELYEQALAIQGSALGKDHPLCATTLHNMASVHDNQGRCIEAMELYEQALAIKCSALGKDHPLYAATLQNMASVHYNQGRYTQAMELYEQALAIQGSALGKYHPSCATTLHNMAIVHDNQGRYTQAMELYEQALAITGSALGKDHPSYAATLINMGCVHYKQSDFDQSLILLQQGLDILMKVHDGNEQHPNVVATRENIEAVKVKQLLQHLLDQLQQEQQEE